jgi:hypothetical protein
VYFARVILDRGVVPDLRTFPHLHATGGLPAHCHLDGGGSACRFFTYTLRRQGISYTSFLLLGGVDRDGWYTSDESTARYSGEATYSLHNMEHAGKYFLWGGMPEYSMTCKTYSVGTETDLDEAGFIGTLDGWHGDSGDVTELSADGEFYRQVVTDWLTSEGVAAPQIDSMQILRVDIEGDGVDEVFISA